MPKKQAILDNVEEYSAAELAGYIKDGIVTLQELCNMTEGDFTPKMKMEVEAILNKIELREVKGRLFGYFGSFSWAGAACKQLAAFGEKMKWEIVGTPVEQKQGMKEASYAGCIALGEAMATKLKNV